MIESTFPMMAKIALWFVLFAALLSNIYYQMKILDRRKDKTFTGYFLHETVMSYALFFQLVVMSALLTSAQVSLITFFSLEFELWIPASLCLVGILTSIISSYQRKDDGVLLDIPLLVFIFVQTVIPLEEYWDYILIGFIVLAVIRMVVLHQSNKNFQRNYLSRTSLEQAFKLLPSGVLFSDERERILAINDKMRFCLSYLKLPTDLGSTSNLASQLLEIAEEQHPEKNNSLTLQYITIGEELWLFTHSFILVSNELCSRIVAQNITAEEQLNHDINLTNQKLAITAEQLNGSLEQVNKAAINESYLQLQSHVHDTVGHRLSILHRYIEDKKDSLDDLHELRKLLGTLMEDLDSTQTPDSKLLLDSLINSFALANVSVEISGELPKDQDATTVFLQILREACTNSIRHTQANHIYVEFREDKGSSYLRISDNGICKTDTIEEHTGIKGMRRAVRALYGTFEVAIIDGKFVIFAEIPHKTIE
ncbi:MAG: sensor histidine kinase [Anaerotardibacter sp.]